MTEKYVAKPFPIQEQWHAKRKELALPKEERKTRLTSEYDAPARKWLAEKLRELAEHIENPQNRDLYVFGCKVPENGIYTEDELMLRYEVVLSYPWPG